MKKGMKTKAILALILLWAGAVFAQLPAGDGVLVDGHFVHNIGMIRLSEWPGVDGNVSNQNIRV